MPAMRQLVASLLRRGLRHWPLLAAIAVFLVLATPDLELPGLHYDEALEAALPAALLLRGEPLGLPYRGLVHLGSTSLPLMVQNHIGAVQVYAAMPFIALLGPTTLALRAMTVLVGALTICGVYAFVAQVYGRSAAAAAALWLAAFPSFVFWSRQGAFVTNLSPCLAAWAFAAGANLHTAKSPRLLVLTGLLAGLAVWAKVSALWLVIGLMLWFGLYALAAWRRRTALVAASRRALPLAIGFAIGTLPLAVYNLLTGFATFTAVSSSASETYLGTSNRDLAVNIMVRIGQFGQVLLSGGGEHLAFLGGSHQNWWSLASPGLALAVSAAVLITQRGRGWQRALLAPWLIVACIGQSCYTISALWHTHFAIAVWLPAVAVGAAVGAVANSEWWQAARPTRLAAWRYAILLVLGAVLVTQVQTVGAYMTDLRSTGGFGSHTSAISDVSRFLAEQPEQVVALDWGFAAPIDYLTDGRQHVEEFYGFSRETPPDFAAALAKRFGRNEFYLTHVPGQEAFVRRQAFLDAVAAAGLQAETVNVSIRRDGLPMIEVWTVRPVNPKP